MAIIFASLRFAPASLYLSTILASASLRLAHCGCGCARPRSLPEHFELGTYIYIPKSARRSSPRHLVKNQLSHEVRHQIKAEVIIFLLRYWPGVDSTSLSRTTGEKLSKVESLLDFGRLSSLPMTIIFI